MPKFRTLTGQFAAYIQDGPDPNITPDRLPMDGTVTFTPVYTGGVIAFPNLVPPEFARPETIRAKIVGGETFVEVASGTEEPPTLQPLSLMVTVDDEATQTWSWRAEFSNMRVFGGNGELSIPAWSFRVPDGTGPVDLTELVPLKSGGTVDVTKGPRGAGLQNITAIDGQLVFAYTDGEETTVPIPEAVQGPQGEPGPAGADGGQGPEGPQGPPGEIPDLLVGNITDATPTGKNLMLAATEGAARNALGLQAGATAINGSLSELENGASNSPRVWTPASIAEYATSKARESAESAVASGPGSESRPEEFGAVGDGSTDDTNAIQAWLNSAPKRKVLSAGTYLVKELTLSAPDVSISSYGGTLLGSVAESTMLTVTSAGVSLDGVALNGDNKARQGVVFTGGGFASVTNSAARNFRSTVSTAAAVVFRDNIDGFTVSGCMFENVVSVGDTSIGNSNGAARGVWVTTANHEATGATAGRGVIHDNTFRGIEGEEGDAIQVIVLPGYASGKCDIVGNYFHDFSRRAVKLQASDCIVSGNVMVSDAVSNGYAKAHCAVDSQYAENNVIKDNTIRLTGFSRGISVTGGDSGLGVPARGGIIVSGNLIHGGPIIMSNQQGPWVVDNTLFTGDSQYSIYVQASPGHVISSNTISANHVTDEATAHIYSGVQSDGSIVTDNKLVGGARQWLISVNSKDCIVRNNISTISSNFPRYQGNGVASANTVWEGNVASNASAPFNGYNSVQVHRGFVNTRGPSYVPNVYFTTTDPATNGRSHTKGDIYFDFSITGTSAGFIGWVCTASGAPGTFRRFGALE